MARRIRGQLRLEETSRRIGLREARKDESKLSQYLQQTSSDPSADSLRRVVSHRSFIGWDGEGYTEHRCDNNKDCPGGPCPHHYMLFGASTGDYITGASLDTESCLRLLLDVERKHPNTFHVIFAGNYDVNMILKDLDRNSLLRLKATNKVTWRGYRLEYLRSKWFQVTKDHITVTLYDVFTFFACSFVKALEEYIGKDDEDVRRIKAGKEQRNEFTYADLDTVQRYWAAELRYLVRLCNTLRDYLTTAGIRIARWHGPGAVAGAVLRQRKYKRTSVPNPVSVASQYAYFGGRFEARQIGRYTGEVYQYDIRSAYPSAIRYLPDLSTGEWEHTTSPTTINSFGLYYCRISRGMPSSYTGFGPIPWRGRNGAVYYPTVAHGGTWIWGVELSAILASHWREMVEVVEGWTFQDNGYRPFAFITEMYDKRALWKRQGNAAQLALKLAMNSIYGKLAQQIGAEWKDGQWRLPTYHQLEFAGYITAHARAQLFRAMTIAPEAVIAVETDALFTTSPLPLDIGSSLGQWEETRYSGIAYLQSGLYFARGLDSDEWKPKTRGFTRNRLNASEVFDWLDQTSGYDSREHPFTVNERRFRTIGTHIGKPEWRRWVNEQRDITIGLPGGKREHYPLYCRQCNRGNGKASNNLYQQRGVSGVSYGACLHDTVPALSKAFDLSCKVDYLQESTRYPLVWTGDPPKEYEDPIDSVDWGEVYA